MATRKFGVEIEFIGDRRAVSDALNAAGVTCEVQGYNHRTQNIWKVVTDATVRGGGELVGPPMIFNFANLAIIRTVCTAMETAGATVNRSTGLHVHHDVGDYGIADWKRLVLGYTHNRANIDTFMARSRRTGQSEWCRAPRNVAGIESANSLRSIYSAISTRYTALNVASFFKHGTVEFRQHQGTTDGEKMVRWIELTNAMVEKARHEDLMPNATTLREFLENLRTVTGQARRVHRITTTGIAGQAYSLLEQGYEDFTILRLIRDANPDCATKIKSIRNYRSRWNKAQRLQANPETQGATGTRELISQHVVDFFITRADAFGTGRRQRRAA